jgi:competence protein ComEC
VAYFLALLICLNPILLSEWPSPHFVVWNVGQGQWTTWVDNKRCLHFDSGGEFFNAQKILAECKEKENFLYLSHWDWDHMGFILKLQQLVPHLCLEVPPEGRSSRKKEWMLSKIAKCEDPLDITEQLPAKPPPPKIRRGKKQKPATNDLSNIFVVNKNILVPGDSPAKMEKIWAPEIHTPIEFLVLSHHGSRTATSEFFLKKVPNARLAIASCRKKKYGHPHRETVERLKVHHIPLLTTEDWGNIYIDQ